MAKKKSAAETPSDELPFEDAYLKLEEVVRLLEDGQLNLSDSLARYEEGVRYLKHCHVALERAERKITLLTGVDSEGNAVTESFDDTDHSLEEKQESRGRRRSRSTAGKPSRARRPTDDSKEDDVDTQKGLF